MLEMYLIESNDKRGKENSDCRRKERGHKIYYIIINKHKSRMLQGGVTAMQPFLCDFTAYRAFILYLEYRTEEGIENRTYKSRTDSSKHQGRQSR